MCQSIQIVGEDEPLEVLGQLVERFGADKLRWHDGYAPKPGELANAMNACFCGLDIEATAKAVGYTPLEYRDGDPMESYWRPFMPEADHQFIVAATIVATWMEKYKRYLRDGDPDVVHPKARSELILMIAEALATANHV